MSKDPSEFINHLNGFSRIAAAYSLTTLLSSPPMAFAALSGSEMTNEMKSFLQTINKDNLKKSLHPHSWARAAARRLLVTPVLGEGVNKTSRLLNDLTPVQRFAMYGVLSVAMSAVETALTSSNEAKQILFSRSGVLPDPDQLKRSSNAAIRPMIFRNIFPVVALFTAKEIAENMESPDPKVVAAIGAFCGIVTGALSMPATVASHMAIKTGKRPKLSDVWGKSGFRGWQARAMQQGISILSIISAREMLDSNVKSPEEKASEVPSSKPHKNKDFGVERLLEKVIGLFK
jgi:hypothetical protein